MQQIRFYDRLLLLEQRRHHDCFQSFPTTHHKFDPRREPKHPAMLFVAVNFF